MGIYSVVHKDHGSVAIVVTIFDMIIIELACSKTSGVYTYNNTATELIKINGKRDNVFLNLEKLR